MKLYSTLLCLGSYFKKNSTQEDEVGWSGENILESEYLGEPGDTDPTVIEDQANSFGIIV